MKLSILLITYNQENYISKAIEGILIQNIPFEYEIILCDDSSKDKTIEITKRLLQDKPLKILDNKVNVGISQNYKRGFAACSGQYIAILEGDDYWVNSERIIKHIDFLDQHHECVLSMNRLIKYNENTEEFKIQPWIFNTNYQYFNSKEIALENRLGNLSACVFRKNEINKLNERIYELNIADWMLSLALSKFGFIVVLKEATSVYRVHDKGEWSKLNKKNKIENTINSINQYDKYFNFQYTREFKINKKNLNPTIIYKLSKFSILDFFPPILGLFIPKIIKIIYQKLKFKK